MTFKEIFDIIYISLLLLCLINAFILMFRVSRDMYISQKNIKTINKEIQRRLDEGEITEDELDKTECDVLMKNFGITSSNPGNFGAGKNGSFLKKS